MGRDSVYQFNGWNMQFYIIIHTGNSCLHRGLAPRLETPSINPNPVSKNRNSINTMGTCRTWMY